MSALLKSDIHPRTRQADDDPLLMLSAALDGETAHGETDACIMALRRDETLRQNWSEYHLIGDLMRGVAPASDDFMARFSEQLAAEPTVLAPRRSVWPQRVAVASLASFAVWGVVSISGLMSDTGAPMAPPAGFQQAALKTDPERAIPADYLVAHQEYAPMAVMSPYQRTVAVVEEPR